MVSRVKVPFFPINNFLKKFRFLRTWKEAVPSINTDRDLRPHLPLLVREFAYDSR